MIKLCKKGINLGVKNFKKINGVLKEVGKIINVYKNFIIVQL